MLNVLVLKSRVVLKKEVSQKFIKKEPWTKYCFSLKLKFLYYHFSVGMRTARADIYVWVLVHHLVELSGKD